VLRGYSRKTIENPELNWGYLINSEDPWESLTTTTPSTLHLRQCEEENWKSMSQTEWVKITLVGDLGMLTLPGLCFFACQIGIIIS
jgi:hypothetical protein